MNAIACSKFNFLPDQNDLNFLDIILLTNCSDWKRNDGVIQGLRKDIESDNFL